MYVPAAFDGQVLITYIILTLDGTTSSLNGAIIGETNSKCSTDFIYGQCASFARPMSFPAWITAAIGELILFLMVFVKARRHKRGKFPVSMAANRDVVALMARDSTLHFDM